MRMSETEKEGGETPEKRFKEEKVDPNLFLRFLKLSIKDELPSKNDLTNPYTKMRNDMTAIGIIIGGLGGLFVSAVLVFLGYSGTWPFLVMLGMIIGKEIGFMKYLKIIGAVGEQVAISSAVMKGAFGGFVIIYLLSWSIPYSLVGAAFGIIIGEKVGFAWWRAKVESLRLRGLI